MPIPLQKISTKSVHKFASNPTDRQTDKQTSRQTDRIKNITSFFGGGNKSLPSMERAQYSEDTIELEKICRIQVPQLGAQVLNLCEQ